MALIQNVWIRRLTQYSLIDRKLLSIALDYLCTCCVHRHLGASLSRQTAGAGRAMDGSPHGFFRCRSTIKPVAYRNWNSCKRLLLCVDRSADLENPTWRYSKRCIYTLSKTERRRKWTSDFTRSFYFDVWSQCRSTRNSVGKRRSQFGRSCIHHAIAFFNS